MDPVSGINRIIQTLGKRLSEQKSVGKAAGQHGSTHSNRQAMSSKAISKTDLQRRIADALKNVSEDDERRSAKIFVDNILAWKLGNEALNDPDFSEISNDVIDTLTQDAQEWATLQDYLRSLRNS